MDALTSFITEYDDYFIAFFISAPRIYGFMQSSQILSSTSIPAMSRTAAMMTLAFMIAPANLGFAHTSDKTLTFFAILIAKEYAIGALLGFLLAWIFWVVQTAGAFIDNQRGASIASSIDPLLGAESSPIGDMFSLVFMTYIFATGTVLRALGLLFKSFVIWPVSRAWPTLPFALPVLALHIFDNAMEIAFDIAAPVVAVMFLAEFALAMVSRFAPQVQVFVLAMPIKSILAVFMLIFYTSVLFPYADRQVGRAWVYADRLYTLLGIAHDPYTTYDPPPAGQSP